MALFKKQTPKKKRNLDRIRKLISRAEQRGYRFPQQLKDELPTYSTQKLKGLTAKKLYAQATAIDYETGEILSGTEARKKERSISARLGALTRKARKAAENVVQGIKERVAPVGPPAGALSPESTVKALVDGGDVAGALSPESTVEAVDGGGVIVSNILDDFIAMLDEPSSPYGISVQGRQYRRSGRVTGEVDAQKTNLRNLVDSVIAQIGRSALGWRLQQHADEVSSAVEVFRYASNATQVQSASTHLATIINGGPLSLSQAIDLGAQSEYNESWEEPE